MRVLTPLKGLSAAAAIALLAGCSGGGTSALAPKTFTPQGHVHSLMGRVPVVVGPLGLLRVNTNTAHHFKAFACPAKGSITYMSDFNNSVINVYAGDLAGQAPCGQITGLLNPQGMYVKADTHDLYVANTGGENVLVFHRGSTTPYKTLTDPSGQFVVDVTLANDGTVIASNIFAPDGSQAGSISTWDSSGNFVGNFPMVNDFEGLFVTVQKDGTVYFNDLDATSGAGLMWSGKCPGGACGSFTSTGVTSVFPGGLRSDLSQDVVQQDQSASGGGSQTTYQPPGFGIVSTCTLNGGDPVTMDLNRPAHKYYFADAFNTLVEVAYPTCAPIGSVQGNTSGLPIGAAHDHPIVR
jgi:hypothetical protein